MPRTFNRRPPAGLFPEFRRSALAKSTGLHIATVVRILNRRQKASPETVTKLARAMELSDIDLAAALASLSGDA